MVERLGTGQQRGISHALGEIVPRMTDSMAANGSSPDALPPARPDYFRVQAHLIVDRLAQLLELLLMLFLGAAKQLDQYAGVQTHQLISHHRGAFQHNSH